MQNLSWSFWDQLCCHAKKTGWTLENRDLAARASGLDLDEISQLFSTSRDLVLGFARAADVEMLAIAPTDWTGQRVHERIADLILIRFALLASHKTAVQRSLVHVHGKALAQISWGTVDAVWIGAGDASTDINRYSKRGLLHLALAPTMLDWLTQDLDETTLRSRLEDRLQAAMKLGKRLSKCMPMLPSVSPKNIASIFGNITRFGNMAAHQKSSQSSS